MEDIPYLYRLPTTFYIDGQAQSRVSDESGLLNLQKGQGVIWEDGRRLRVLDSWFSFEKNARFDRGLHVFLEDVSGEANEDLPGSLAPDYFRDA
jgi:hypothetical protein